MKALGVLACLAGVSLFAATGEARAVLIDSFNETFQEIQLTSGSALDSRVAPEALGGHRTLYLEIEQSPVNPNTPVSLAVNPAQSSLGLYSEPFGGKGNFKIAWDGTLHNQGNSFSINTTGLGGEDLSGNGSNIGIATHFLSDHDFEATFTVYTDENNFSSMTKTISGTTSNSLEQHLFAFQDFSPVEGGGADFSNVGAIEFSMQGSASATDLAFSVVQTVVPEPSSFALLGIGALGAIGFGWRRRKNRTSASAPPC